MNMINRNDIERWAPWIICAEIVWIGINVLRAVL